MLHSIRMTGPGHGDDDGHHATMTMPMTTTMAAPPRLRVAGRVALASVVLAAGILAALRHHRCGRHRDRRDPVRRSGAGADRAGSGLEAAGAREAAIPVDLRLRSTSTGLQDVGTRDGLRVLVQAYIAWQVAPDPEHAAVRAQPCATIPMRPRGSCAPGRLRAAGDGQQFRPRPTWSIPMPRSCARRSSRAKLRDQVAAPGAADLWDRVRQVGIQRLSLPEPTLVATVGRMRSERETVAAQRTAEGLRAAAEIRSRGGAGRPDHRRRRAHRGRRYRGRIAQQAAEIDGQGL